VIRRHAVLLGVLVSLGAPAVLAGQAAKPTAVYRVKDGETDRELRVWKGRGGRLRFEVTASRSGDARPGLLAGVVKRQPLGDAECDGYDYGDSGAISECWEVREHMGYAGACSVDIRVEIETGKRASVLVAACAEAPRFHSRAIYEKVN
jgi:hypothetical protein